MDTAILFASLSQAILVSLAQGLIIYLIVRLIMPSMNGLSAAWRYRLLYGALMLIVCGFMINVFRFYNPDESFPNQPDLSPLLIRKVPQSGLVSLWDRVISYSVYVGWVYFTGLLIQCLMLLKGFYHIKNIKETGKLQLNTFWNSRIESFCRKLKIARQIPVYFSDQIMVPFTSGFLKPIIIFPVALVNRLTAEQAEAILLHELAHIKRNDYLLNIIQRIAESILFFNPAVWLLSKEIKKEREYCCDDLVLQFAEDSTEYAKALVEVEENRQVFNHLAMKATGTGKFSLLNRIKRLTDMKTLHSNPAQKLVAVFALVAVGLSLAWAIPQDSTKTKAVKSKPKQVAAIPAAPPAPPEPVFAVPPVPPIPSDSLLAPPPPIPPLDKINMIPPLAPDIVKISKDSIPVYSNKEMLKQKYYNSREWNKLQQEFKNQSRANSDDILKAFKEKQQNSAEWKAIEEKFKKSSDETMKHFNSIEWQDSIKKNNKGKFDSPEWKAKVADMEKTGAEIQKKFDSPEWKKKVADMEKMGVEMQRQFDSPEWKAKVADMEKMGAEMEKKFNSPEWKKKVQDMEKMGLEIQKFDSPEWKRKMQDMEKMGLQMQKKFDSPEWKKKMQEMENMDLDLEFKLDSQDWKNK